MRGLVVVLYLEGVSQYPEAHSQRELDSADRVGRNGFEPLERQAVGTCLDSRRGLVHLNGLSGFSNMRQHRPRRWLLFDQVAA